MKFGVCTPSRNGVVYLKVVCPSRVFWVVLCYLPTFNIQGALYVNIWVGICCFGSPCPVWDECRFWDCSRSVRYVVTERLKYTRTSD